MIALLILIVLVIGTLVVAHIKSTFEDTSSSGNAQRSRTVSNVHTRTVQKRNEQATDEAWEYHLRQALHETDLFVVERLSPTDYQQLAKRKTFMDQYVGYFLTPIFTWGYTIGQRYSMGQTVSNEDKRLVHSNIDNLAIQLKEVMSTFTNNDQVITLYINAARNCLHKGIAAGEKQGGYVLVSR